MEQHNNHNTREINVGNPNQKKKPRPLPKDNQRKYYVKIITSLYSLNPYTKYTHTLSRPLFNYTLHTQEIQERKEFISQIQCLKYIDLVHLYSSLKPPFILVESLPHSKPKQCGTLHKLTYPQFSTNIHKSPP